MNQYQKILAVIDADEEEQKSLSRALEIATRSGASVTAFLSIYELSYEMTTMLSMDERETMRQAVVDDRTDWLTDVVEQIANDVGVSIDVKVVWHNRPYESIIYEVIDNSYDLIVKGTHDHSTLKSVIFTPTDWHLMRKSPVPVLLVKEHDWPANGQIIAALNVGVEDEAHMSLNDVITEKAQGFAALLGAQVNLVNAFPGTPVNIAIEIPEFDPIGYTESVKKHHHQAMQTHAENHHVDERHCHVKEGLPEDVIPEVAREIDAELVIIGTVGRQGLSAALIGNTAEHVIDKLDCDVLAIKPKDFVCPIKR
jgi:universal stress protein E